MKYLKLLVVFCALLLFAAPAHSTLYIYPTTGVIDLTRWEGNETSQAAINAIINPIIGSSEELYKSNVGDESPYTPVEEGPLAGSYETTFFNTPGDPTEATIRYTDGDYVGPIAFLLVKDGAATPGWYLFNLTAFGWLGTETLELSGFWADIRGAISHVSLYGDKVPVPEPATMLLLGFGLIGLAVVGKRNFRKN